MIESLKVSIITVCFNSERTIEDTLISVSGQSYQNIEHIVVDGASTDSTLSILRAHADRIAHLISEPDLGIYDAMNKGIALASGNVIGFLNADDVFARKDSIEKVVTAFERNSAVAVYGDLVYVRGENLDAIVRLWRSGKFSPAKLKFGWMPPHPTFYVRNELVTLVGNFDTSFRIAADYDFILRCLSRKDLPVVYVPDILVRMRAGGASNRSVMAVLRKSQEDYRALRKNRIGGWFTLVCKNFRKVFQFFDRSKI